jgi:hypothetical protein
MHALYGSFILRNWVLFFSLEEGIDERSLTLTVEDETRSFSSVGL